MSRAIIRGQQPIQPTPIRAEGVISYDTDNSYPQRLSALITASKTAVKAAEKMAENIECDGFANDSLGQMTNGHGDSFNEILAKISADLSRFNGFALAVQYTAIGEVANVYHVPFEFVRIVANEDSKKDTTVRQYKVFNNWDKSAELEKRGDDATIYAKFDKSAVIEQISEAGGVENYNGQLYYAKFASYKGYPLSPFHAVQAEMYTEASTAKTTQRLLSKGFHENKIIEHLSLPTEEENEEFGDAIEAMAGDDMAGAFVTIKNPNMMDRAVFVHEVGTPITGDFYKTLAEPLKRDICMSAANLPLGLIDTAALGVSNVSGNTINELLKMYRNSLLKYRNLVSISLAKIYEVSEATFAIDDKLNQLDNDNRNE